MRKGKVGLQKQVSSIFTGIQVPGKDAPQHARPAAPAAPAAPASVAPAAPPMTSQHAAKQPVPAPAPRTVIPRPLTPSPKPFTIPEPAQQSAPAPAKQVYEKPAPIPNVYEPPVQNRKVYETPQTPPAAHEITKTQLTTKQPWQFPLLKVLKTVKEKLLASKPGDKSLKQKIIVILLPVLGLVFIYVISNVLKKPVVQPGPAPSNKPSASTTTVALDNKVSWEIPSPYPDNLRDPTGFGAPPDVPPDQGRPPVKGIVFSEDNPIAVVGERIVSVGETVQGATVVKINPDSVEFSKGDQKWTQEVER